MVEFSNLGLLENQSIIKVNVSAIQSVTDNLPNDGALTSIGTLLNQSSLLNDGDGLIVNQTIIIANQSTILDTLSNDATAANQSALIANQTLISDDVDLAIANISTILNNLSSGEIGDATLANQSLILIDGDYEIANQTTIIANQSTILDLVGNDATLENQSTLIQFNQTIDAVVDGIKTITDALPNLGNLTSIGSIANQSLVLNDGDAIGKETRFIAAKEDFQGDAYYVRTAGDNTSDGTTWEKAVANVATAVGLCSADVGDTVFVDEGIYDENVNGTIGVAISKSKVSVIGVGYGVVVKNTNTSDGGRVFKVTANDVRLENMRITKGESTSENAVVVDVDGANYLRFYDIPILVEKDSFTGLKYSGGATCCLFSKRVRSIACVHATSLGLGTGIDFDDCEHAIASGTEIQGCKIGVRLNSSTSRVFLSQELNINDCDTAIKLESGTSHNILSALIVNCSTNYDDQSGNTLNPRDASITFLADSQKYIHKQPNKIWYVNGLDGNDSYSGNDPEQPFKTVKWGLAHPNLSSGDSIHVRAGTYNESSLDMSKDGLKMLCEWGVNILAAPTGSGRVLKVSGDNCYVENFWSEGDVSWSDDGIQITGAHCKLSECGIRRASTAFDIHGNKCLLKSCRALEYDTCGFNSSTNEGLYRDCIATGDENKTTQGFCIHANKKYNVLDTCVSGHNMSNSFWIDAGANYNMLTRCVRGTVDGVVSDNGSYNTFAQFKEGSLIAHAQSADQDMKDLFDMIGRNQTSMMVADYHTTYVWPEVSNEICTMHTGAANTFGPWNIIMDSANHTFSAKFNNTDGHLTSMMLEDASIGDLTYIYELSYGDAKTPLLNTRFHSATNQVGARAINRIHPIINPNGEELYYRGMAENASVNCEFSFRWHVAP